MEKIVASCELRVMSKDPSRGPFVLRKISPRTRNSQLTTRNFSPAFTLVELMISIAMVLVLIVGVNYVFTKTTDAVGAGQQVNTFARDSQTTQAVLFNDFRHISKDSPCFVIGSQLVTQFLNSADAQSGSDPTQIVVDPHTIVQIGNTFLAPATANLSQGILNFRNHRADIVKFFAHSLFQRRSANDGSYSSQTTSQDAFITLGHALLPTNDSSVYVGPVTDSLTNPDHLVQPNGYGNTGTWYSTYVSTAGAAQRLGAYASDWVLARSAVLLKPLNTNLNTNLSGTAEYTEVCYPQFPNTINGVLPNVNSTGHNVIPYLANLTPLGNFSPDSNYVYTNNAMPITVSQMSRYDLAMITTDQFRRAIADEIAQWRSNDTANVNLNGYFTGGHLWWNPLVYDLAASEQPIAAVGNAGAATYAAQAAYAVNTTPPYSAMSYFVNPTYVAAPPNPAFPYPAQPPTYLFGTWNNAAAPGTFGAMKDANGNPSTPNLARVVCNPQMQAPLTSASIAQMSPYFLQHCSQFIVEYAGDYLQQNANGTIAGVGQDGQIDFTVDANGNKKIKWYGMPRSSNGGTPNVYVPGAGNGPGGSYIIRGYSGNATVGNDNPIDGPTMRQFVDVIPLRDYYTMWFNHLNGDNLVYQPPWEVDINFDPAGVESATAPGGDYAAPTPYAGTNPLKVMFGDSANPSRYVAAWYNDMPAMIRILIKVDDPNNKLKDGPWYEYVFKLK
jgi:hypothetical protein